MSIYPVAYLQREGERSWRTENPSSQNQKNKKEGLLNILKYMPRLAASTK